MKCYKIRALKAKKHDCYFYKSIKFTSKNHQLNKCSHYIFDELKDVYKIEKWFNKVKN